MVKNMPYEASGIPHEWWSICEYADICFLPKFPNIFYNVCINGKCSFKNYRKLSEFFPSKKELQIMDLTRKILGD